MTGEAVEAQRIGPPSGGDWGQLVGQLAGRAAGFGPTLVDAAELARLRAAAGTLERLAADLSGLARQVAAADGVAWRSVAAQAFRDRLAEQVASLHGTAAGVQQAAAAVARHAAALAATGGAPRASRRTG
jgi:hypothetical protein